MNTTAELCATPKPATASQGEGRRRNDRRKHPRYCINGGGAEVRQPGVDVPICARLNDISLGGCYLETRVPLTVFTYIQLALTLDGQRLRAKGQVVGSHPNFGMDVKFLHLSDTDRPVLEAWIAALAAQAESSTRHGSGREPAPSLDQETAARLGQAVAEFFRSNPVMNREEFQQLRLL